MTIVPDRRDWTWVLERPCPECGLDTRTVDARQVAGRLRANAAVWNEVLTAPGDVTTRPAPDRWSPLEYGCHVRDVFVLFDRRLHLMLDVEDPTFPNWDQDATAVADGYGGQDPSRVAGELCEAAVALCRSLDAVEPEQWRRTGSRSDGARFTVETLARYLLHDPVHHLHDVGVERAAG